MTDRPRLAAIAFMVFLAGCRSTASVPPVPATSPSLSPTPASLRATLAATWGGVPPASQFDLPSGVAVGSDGSVYVADTGRERVLAFARSGAVAVWSALADGTRLRRPSCLAVNGAGSVYVADTDNHRIVRVSAAGGLRDVWGGPGGEPGRFNSPTAVAVDRSGAVYVADTKNHRVQKFSAAGTPLAAWGGYGSAPGRFNTPAGIAVERGAVYVADTWNHRVQKFDATGKYLREWGRLGRGDGRFNAPAGIAVDRSGQVFVISTGLQPAPPRDVADTLRVQRVQVFSGDRQFLRAWGRAGGATGEFDRAMALAVDGAGNIYVADTFNHRVQQFAPSGAPLRRWGALPAEVFKRPSVLTADAQGDVYVADQGNFRIVKVNRSGAIVAVWRFPDSTMFEDLAVDAAVCLYVALTDAGAGLVRVLDETGRRRREIRGLGAITGVAVDGRGFVYVGDWRGNEIRRIGPDGESAGRWPPDFPGDLTADRAGAIFAVERGRHRVVKLDAQGRVRSTWGARGTGAGQFLDGKIAVDAQGRLHLADPLTSRVMIFGARGGVLGSWAEWGSAPAARFYQPRAITVDAGGRVYVGEPLMNRVVVFALAGLRE